MATKPENRFRGKVHAKLDERVYQEKTNNPYRGGTPDDYYEGESNILWVEYKYVPKIPKVLNMSKLVTALQNRWLTRAHRNNKPTAVIVGFEAGVLVLTDPEEWQAKIGKDRIEPRLITIQDAANWIANVVL